MPKNITYHQTAAQKARRTRNDSASVTGLGLAGVAATQGKTGVTSPVVRGKLKRTTQAGKSWTKAAARPGLSMGERGSYLKGGAANVGRGLKGAAKVVHPGRGLAEAAVGAGAAGVVAGEARNIYHTRQEQKLRRQRVAKAEEPKMDKKFCKQHGKFDDCASQVEKALKGLRGSLAAKKATRALDGKIKAADRNPFEAIHYSAQGKGAAAEKLVRHSMIKPLAVSSVAGGAVGGAASGVAHDKMSKAYQAKPKPGDPGFMGHAIKNAHKRHRAALKAQKEEMGKAMVTYSPDERFQKSDDGIIHLTGTGSGTSVNRGAGGLVPLGRGTRDLDGTPMMGHAPGAAEISEDEKAGKSSGSKPVQGSGIMEQVPGGPHKKVSKSMDGHDAFLGDISKAEKNVRATNMARYGLGPVFTAKPGDKVKASMRTVGHTYVGQGAGAAGGALAGAAATRNSTGALVGGVGGMIAGGVAGARHAADKNAREGLLKPKYVKKG